MQPSSVARSDAAPVLRAARPDEIPAITELVASADLPPLFVEAYIDGFIVAERDGALLACGGVEMYDDCAVLRSIVVAETARGLGLGRRLAEALAERARVAGAAELYLFTEGAHDFWQHLGFVDVPLGDWAQPPRAGWQYQFIAANQNAELFRSVNSMWKAA